ncbi:hypothetical protein PsYK624_101200 [Phanerochaete sordida]|uniref:Uncharacterized protein n=1 Tax=Phanerochaete sordida TaxID=48140 RepID=A0A9P3LGT0_9APHY|nr:hypothetical protein PsYK624_101200 [Phanerochaete sordida]
MERHTCVRGQILAQGPAPLAAIRHSNGASKRQDTASISKAVAQQEGFPSYRQGTVAPSPRLRIEYSQSRSVANSYHVQAPKSNHQD